MFTIQQAKISDVPELQQVFEEVIVTVNQKDYSLEEVQDWASCGKNADRWENLIQELYFIVARDEDLKLVGFSAISGEGYLHFMFVHKEYQGQGIAKELYQQIEKYAIQKGINTITSEVSITALPFFIKQGFKVDEKQTRKANQLFLVNYKMSKKIRF